MCFITIKVFEQMLLLSREPDRLRAAGAALDNAAGLFDVPAAGTMPVTLERWRIPYAAGPTGRQPAWCWYAIADCHRQWRLHVLRDDELGAFLAMGRWLHWAKQLERALQPTGESRANTNGAIAHAALGFFVQQALTEQDWRARLHWAGLAIEQQIAPLLVESRHVEDRHLSFPREIVSATLDRAADRDEIWP